MNSPRLRLHESRTPCGDRVLEREWISHEGGEVVARSEIVVDSTPPDRLCLETKAGRETVLDR